MAEVISISSEISELLGNCWLCKYEDDYSGELFEEWMYPQSDCSALDALLVFIRDFVPDEDMIDGIYVRDEARDDAQLMSIAMTYKGRFGIEYRSMLTGIHHVLIFENEATAVNREASFELIRSYNGGEITDKMVDELLRDSLSDEEVNCHNVEDMNLPNGRYWRYYEDNEHGIFVVNMIPYDFYI